MKKALLACGLVGVSLSGLFACGGGGGGGSDAGVPASRGTGVRVLHAGIDSGPVSLVVSPGNQSSGALSFGQQSNYISIGAGSVTLGLQTDAGERNVQVFIEDGQEVSLLLSGAVSSGDFSASVIEDRVFPEDLGSGVVRLVNGSSGIGGISLRVGPVQTEGVNERQASDFSEIPPGTYSFELSGEGGLRRTGELSIGAGEEVTVLASGIISKGVLTASLIRDRD